MAAVISVSGCLLLGACGQAGGIPGEEKEITAQERADDAGKAEETGTAEETGMTEETGTTEEIVRAVETPAEEEIPEGDLEKNSLGRWAESLAEGDPEAFGAESMRGVSVVRDGIPCFAVSYEPRVYKNSFDCWAISVPYESMAVVDTEAMYAYFQVLADMELTPAEGITRQQAGMEESSDTVFAAYYSKQTAEGGQAEPDRGILFRFGGEDEAGNRYVEAGDRLFLVDGGTAETIFGVDPYTCVLKVVSVVSVETVSKVTVEAGQERYEMTVVPGAFRLGEKQVESGTFYELYTELMSVFIEKELSREEQEEWKDGKTDGELLMRIVYERSVEGAPRIIQEYYAYDESYAAVRVNGTAFFLVDRETLGRLQETLRDAF